MPMGSLCRVFPDRAVPLFFLLEVPW